MKWIFMFLFPLSLMADEVFMIGQDKYAAYGKEKRTESNQTFMRLNMEKDVLDMLGHRCDTAECLPLKMRFTRGADAKWKLEVPPQAPNVVKAEVKVASDGFKVQSFSLDQTFADGDTYQLTYQTMLKGATLKSKVKTKEGHLVNERTNILQLVDKKVYELGLRGKKMVQ